MEFKKYICIYTHSSFSQNFLSGVLKIYIQNLSRLCAESNKLIIVDE